MKWKILLGALMLGIAAWSLNLVREHVDPDSVSHEAVRYWLKAYGESFYEFHAKTRRWPASVVDLGETSLPMRFPLWRSTAGLVVFLWPKDLKDDPQQNASTVLLYYNKGLISELGKKWVCFGDLRLEYVKDKELEALLRASRR